MSFFSHCLQTYKYFRIMYMQPKFFAINYNARVLAAPAAACCILTCVRILLALSNGAIGRAKTNKT